MINFTLDMKCGTGRTGDVFGLVDSMLHTSQLDRDGLGKAQRNVNFYQIFHSILMICLNLIITNLICLLNWILNCKLFCYRAWVSDRVHSADRLAYGYFDVLIYLLDHGVADCVPRKYLLPLRQDDILLPFVSYIGSGSLQSKITQNTSTWI